MTSKRTSIVAAIANKIKEIDGRNPSLSNLHGNVEPKLRFWDEINDFPFVCVVPGSEMREYLPGNFTWRYLNVSIKIYTRGEDCAEQLELLLDDVERTIDDNRVLTYDDDGNETTEILVTSITTDEGLLAPFGVGEINLQVRYQLA